MLGIIRNSVIRQYIIVVTVNLTIICTGMALAWPSPALVKLRNTNTTVLPHPVTDDEGSWIVSAYTIPSMITIPLSGVILSHTGRKSLIVIASTLRPVAGFLYTFSSSVWMLILGRVICSISDSMLLITVPTYASEIADKEIRGALGSILQISSSMGFLLIFGIGPFVSYLALNLMLTVSFILTTIPLIFLPDSPLSLYNKGEISKAIEVLTTVRRSDIEAKEQIKEYEITNEEKFDKSDLKSKPVLKALLIMVVFGIGIQTVGANTVSYYLQSILESTHTNIRSDVASAIIGGIQFISSFSPIFLCDKFGRKPLLVGTLFCLGIGLLGLGTFFTVRENNELNDFMNYLPLISIVVITFTFSAGIGSLFWIISSELFDGPLRSVGVTVGLTMTMYIMFPITKFFPIITSTLGTANIFWFFAANCFLLCIFSQTVLPETKGKSFAEIQVALGGKP